MRVSRAEQAQAIAHDTRREWGRSSSNLSFSAKIVQNQGKLIEIGVRAADNAAPSLFYAKHRNIAVYNLIYT